MLFGRLVEYTVTIARVCIIRESIGSPTAEAHLPRLTASCSRRYAWNNPHEALQCFSTPALRFFRRRVIQPLGSADPARLHFSRSAALVFADVKAPSFCACRRRACLPTMLSLATSALTMTSRPYVAAARPSFCVRVATCEGGASLNPTGRHARDSEHSQATRNLQVALHENLPSFKVFWMALLPHN